MRRMVPPVQRNPAHPRQVTTAWRAPVLQEPWRHLAAARGRAAGELEEAQADGEQLRVRPT